MPKLGNVGQTYKRYNAKRKEMISVMVIGLGLISLDALLRECDHQIWEAG
jgi:hypothetical protein